MTSKIFSVATFIVVSWLAVTVITTSKRVNTLESTLLNGMAASSSAMSSRVSSIELTQVKNHKAVLAQLEQIANTPAPAPPAAVPSAELGALKSETAALKQQLANANKLSELKQAYKHVIESELEKVTDAQQAAQKLLSTKGAIWKTSTKHPTHKESLQALMAPIDILAARWKSGDTKGTVQPVFKVLKQTLATLDADI